MLDNGPDTVLSEIALPQAAQLRDSARARKPVLAFVADDATEAALHGGFLDIIEGFEIRRGTILHAIKALASEPTPRTLIVDISGVANPLSEMDNLAHVCTPDVSVLVIGENNDLSLYRQLIREVGVAEYVHKPLTRDRVARLFVPRIAGVTVDATREGNVIAVAGARGGVGTTTLAVNLALQLASASRGHVALLDLHLQYGTTALMLGAKPPGGLRIALEQPERADALFLDRVGVAINDRLRLIAADEALDRTPAPTQDGIRRVLALLRQRFNYIVVDLPPPDSLAAMQVYRDARHLLLVMAPDLASIRDAGRLRQFASEIGNPQVSIVLNRVGMPGGLPLPMIEQGLGRAPAIQIPDFDKQLGLAANLGKPALGECAGFRKVMTLLALEVSGTAAKRSPRTGVRSLVGRMFKS